MRGRGTWVGDFASGIGRARRKDGGKRIVAMGESDLGRKTEGKVVGDEVYKMGEVRS